VSTRIPVNLVLENVEKRAQGDVHIHSVTMKLVPGEITVLLGATQAGKTTLMRLMAGLEAPTSGKIFVDERDVTGVSVARRDVAMVYQQFINYPTKTVAENIASPLRIARKDNIDRAVRDVAERLGIEQYLQRFPGELSGGQQQRVALARALAKNASLLLLDEPLVNLDYKLREALRIEFATLLGGRDSTVVYATTEPSEALLLGGYTAVLEKGRLLQYGPAQDVFRAPKDINVAAAMSDPPLNVIELDVLGNEHRFVREISSVLERAPSDRTTIAVRAYNLHLTPRPGDLGIHAAVVADEFTGADTLLRVTSEIGPLVVQCSGVHRIASGTQIELYLAPREIYVFARDGRTLLYPTGEPA